MASSKKFHQNITKNFKRGLKGLHDGTGKHKLGTRAMAWAKKYKLGSSATN